LKTFIKPPQAGLTRLQEMWPVGISNRRGPLDQFSDCHSSLRFSERVRAPNLSKQQFRDLFAVWRDQYRALAERKAPA
jgi:hypothetical protein